MLGPPPTNFLGCCTDIWPLLPRFWPRQAKNGVHGACRERLVREIMRVDQLEWEEALLKVEEMNKENDKGSWLVTFPYKVSPPC